MPGVDGFEFAIDEIDAEIVAITEFELQFDDAVLKFGRVKDGDAVIGLGVLCDVHHAIFEIDLLVAFRAPGAVAGPAIADVLLAGRFFIAGEVVGEKEHGLGGCLSGEPGAKGKEKAEEAVAGHVS
jgi:hypothetical protein